MKAYKYYRTTALALFLTLISAAQPLIAQTNDSVLVDTLQQVDNQPIPEKRPKPMAFIMGRISSKTILQNMPQYKAMQNSMKALKAQYEAEARKSEEDFQRKFEEFMQGQNEFPKTILEKRQNELQSMLEANADFRVKVQSLLAEAEKSLMADVMSEMNDAVTIAAEERGISIVFDMDGGSVPYMVRGLAVDLTSAVILLLGTDEEQKQE